MSGVFFSAESTQISGLTDNRHRKIRPASPLGIMLRHPLLTLRTLLFHRAMRRSLDRNRPVRPWPFAARTVSGSILLANGDAVPLIETLSLGDLAFGAVQAGRVIAMLGVDDPAFRPVRIVRNGRDRRCRIAGRAEPAQAGCLIRLEEVDD
jgi:hypothetical protein